VSRDRDRVPGAGAGAVALRVLNGVREAVGARASGQDHVTLSFNRQTSARDVVTDYLTLDASSISAGTYKLSLVITDLVTDKTTRAQRIIEIVKP
jgi:hypothetical protein